LVEKINISDEEVEKTYLKFKREAEDNGYFLNNDLFFSKELIRSLIINQNRYGYQACPCRLSSGDKSKDLDIICPCDYRDADLNDFGACYCALYVSSEVIKGEKKVRAFPERRNTVALSKSKMEHKDTTVKVISGLSNSKYPVWRCKVCGYLCARENPPEICPICKAKKDRFEKFF